MTMAPGAIDRLVVRQKSTVIANAYAIHPVDDSGAEGPAIAFAQQKLLAMKKQVTFFGDEARTEPVFGFKARQAIETYTVYDVTDAHGP
jgi:hypothetical protein